MEREVKPLQKIGGKKMNEEMNVQTPVTDVTENTEAQAVEQFEEGIELTDTASNEETKDVKTYSLHHAQLKSCSRYGGAFGPPEEDD